MKHLRVKSQLSAVDSSSAAALVHDAVRQYERPLTIYASRLLGDVELAREVVQDTFLKLWTADHASVNGHLAAWLYRVCRNRALDVQRKEMRMTTLQSEQIECQQPIRGDSTPVESTRLCDALQTLPEKQQEAVRLKFQGGLSYQEIGDVMEITANHVGVLIHTALKTLREKFQPMQSTPQTQTQTRISR